MHPLHRVAELLHAAADEITGYADTFPADAQQESSPEFPADGGLSTAAVPVADELNEPAAENNPADPATAPAEPAQPETTPDPPEGHFPDAQPTIGGVATNPNPL